MAELEDYLHPADLGAGALAASIPLVSAYLDAPPNPLKDVKRVSRRKLFETMKPGDVLLGDNTKGSSGFRALNKVFAGSPFYHGGLVFDNGYGLKQITLPGSGDKGESVSSWKKNYNRTVLLRNPEVAGHPKREELIEKLRELASAESAAPYGTKKLGPIGGAALLPKGDYTKNIKVCDSLGEVCTTAPAKILRELGIDTGLNGSVRGLETAKDWLASSKFKPVMMSGSRPEVEGLSAALPGRAALAAALGAGAYKTVQDFRTGDYVSPIIGAAGGAAGYLLGKTLEEKMRPFDTKADFAKAIRPTLSKASPYVGKGLTRRLTNAAIESGTFAAKRRPLTTIVASLLGGLTAYAGSKAVVG